MALVAMFSLSKITSLFMRESSYCSQRILAIAILSVRLSVCLAHGWIKDGLS